jgi:hypothetical protein
MAALPAADLPATGAVCSVALPTTGEIAVAAITQPACCNRRRRVTSGCALSSWLMIGSLLVLECVLGLGVLSQKYIK